MKGDLLSAIANDPMEMHLSTEDADLFESFDALVDALNHFPFGKIATYSEFAYSPAKEAVVGKSVLLTSATSNSMPWHFPRGASREWPGRRFHCLAGSTTAARHLKSTGQALHGMNVLGGVSLQVDRVGQVLISVHQTVTQADLLILRKADDNVVDAQGRDGLAEKEHHQQSTQSRAAGSRAQRFRPERTATRPVVLPPVPPASSPA